MWVSFAGTATGPNQKSQGEIALKGKRKLQQPPKAKWVVVKMNQNATG